MKHLLLILSIIMLTSCSKIDVAKHLEESMAAAENDDWETVHSKLDEVVQKVDIDNVDGAEHLYAFYIQSKYRIGQKDEALNVSVTALEKFPENQIINFYRGKIHYENAMDMNGLDRSNEMKTAVIYLKKAYELKNEDMNALKLLLTASVEANDNNALHYFELAEQYEEFKNDKNFYSLWGQMYRNYNMNVEALRVYSKSWRDHKDSAAILNIAVIWDKKMGKPLVAKKYYIKYMQLLRQNDQITTKKTKYIKVQKRLKELMTSL